MIGCFPDPYPDELLYSVCDRFHERVQYPNKKNTLRELFGDEAAIAVFDLPSNLRNLASALPERWQLVRRAGLRPEVELLPSVQNAINEALDVLKQIPHQHGRDCPPQRMVL